MALKRFRCEFNYPRDQNLIAKFFWAADKQEAMVMAMTWYGGPCSVYINVDS